MGLARDVGWGQAVAAMPHTSRVERPGRSRALVGLTAMGLLAACPAPSPSSPTPRAQPAAPAPTVGNEPAAPPAPAPAPAVAGEDALAPERPASDPAGGALPAALATADVRPVVRSLWRALEAVDAGDAAAMAAAMTDDGRWFAPGRPEESVGGPTDLQRALAPWNGSDTDIDVRHIIDPGDGTFAAQVSVGSREDPELRHELVLLVEPRGELVAAVHHFGDPLGPLRQRASPLPPSGGLDEPLALGPVGEPTRAGGPAETAAVEAAEQLAAALDAREEDAVWTRLAADVVLHDVIARRTRQGRDGWLAGMRETLGPAGRLVVDRHLAGSRFVVVEGAVYGREPAAGRGEPPAEPQEHGFVDVHRFVDGTIAETWHYVNRRGRPHRRRVRP